MADPFPRVRLFVPGTPRSERAWSAALEPLGLHLGGGVLRRDGQDATAEVEWVANDGAFGKAFSFGTVTPPVIEALDAAPGALVLHLPMDLRDGRADVVALVERLRDAGAIAVRLEQSKVGWEVSRWLELFSADDPWAWHRGAVALLSDETSLQSCGMHAFSLPDVMAPLDAEGEALRHLASVLSVYQLGEDPLLLSGHTFAPDRETPRRVIERWPDTSYPEGHPCHNPYGVWRLGPSGGVARRTRELAAVFIPALRVLLEATEQKQGRPLTKERVESLRDEASCITMEHRDAQRLERARGYADLDPELAWEQWQAIHRARAADRSGP